jgi:hypothetical protein
MKDQNYKKLSIEKKLCLPILDPKNKNEYYVILVGFGASVEKRFIEKPKGQKGRGK